MGLVRNLSGGQRLTIVFYRCQHCKQFYEFAQTTCDWCSSPISKIILRKKQFEAVKLTMEEIDAIHAEEVRA
jgi:hypothetical protein